MQINSGNLSELSNVAQKTVFDILVSKGNGVDTKIPRITAIVTKTQHGFDKQGLQKTVENVYTGLVKETVYNAKIKEI